MVESSGFDFGHFGDVSFRSKGGENNETKALKVSSEKMGRARETEREREIYI